MGCFCTCQCALRTAQKAGSSPVVLHSLTQPFGNINGGTLSYDVLDYGLKFNQFSQRELEFITVMSPLDGRIGMDGSAPQEDESRLTSLPRDLYPSTISDEDCFLPEIGRGITRGRSDSASLPLFSSQGPQMSLEYSNTGVPRRFPPPKPAKSLEPMEHSLQMLGANHEVAGLVLRQHSTVGQDPLDRFLRGSYSTFERLQDSNNYPK